MNDKCPVCQSTDTLVMTGIGGQDTELFCNACFEREAEEKAKVTDATESA